MRFSKILTPSAYSLFIRSLNWRNNSSGQPAIYTQISFIVIMLQGRTHPKTLLSSTACWRWWLTSCLFWGVTIQIRPHLKTMSLQVKMRNLSVCALRRTSVLRSALTPETYLQNDFTNLLLTPLLPQTVFNWNASNGSESWWHSSLLLKLPISFPASQPPPTQPHLKIQLPYYSITLSPSPF